MQFDKCQSNLEFNEVLKSDMNLFVTKDITKYILYPYINCTPNCIGVDIQIDSDLGQYTETKKPWLFLEKPYPEKPWISYVSPLSKPDEFNDVTIIGKSCATPRKHIETKKIGYSRKGFVTSLNENQKEIFKLELLNKKENITYDTIEIVMLIQLFNGDKFIFDNGVKHSIFDCEGNTHFYILYKNQLEHPNLKIDICARYGRYKYPCNHEKYLKYELKTIFSCDPIYIESIGLVPPSQ